MSNLAVAGLPNPTQSSPNPMVEVSDDELGVIFRSISSPKDRNSISLVSKQWLRVEGLTRTSLLSLSPTLLLKFLPRFPNLTSFHSPSPLDDVNLLCLLTYCPRLHTLNLNSAPQSQSQPQPQPQLDLTDVGLYAIAKCCRNLSTLLIRNRNGIGDVGVFSLLRFSCHLTCLDLSGCTAVTDQALLAVGLMGSIQSLTLIGCCLITDKGLAMLSFDPVSKNIRKLIISGCNRITDLGVVSLSKMVSLEELSLADCGPGITDLGGLAISRIRSLKKLDLSRLGVADLTLLVVAEGCGSLEEVVISGCTNVVGYGIRAFATHKSLELLVMGSCEEVSVECIKHLVFGCLSLKCIGLDRKVRDRIPLELQEDMNSFCLLDWM